MAVYKIKRFSFLSFIKSVNDRLIENERKYHTKKVAPNNNQFDTLKKIEQKVSKYPTKDMENFYPAIKEFGGLPKEYYQMVDICNKIDSTARYPDWGDGDEYMVPRITELEDIEKILLNKYEYYKGSINNYPLIWIGCQSESELVYDFNKHQWFDISYSPRKRVTNLKSHILRLYEIDIKNYGYDKKGPYLDKDDIKKVQDYYTDIIRIIKSSKIG